MCNLFQIETLSSLQLNKEGNFGLSVYQGLVKNICGGGFPCLTSFFFFSVKYLTYLKRLLRIKIGQTTPRFFFFFYLVERLQFVKKPRPFMCFFLLSVSKILCAV